MRSRAFPWFRSVRKWMTTFPQAGIPYNPRSIDGLEKLKFWRSPIQCNMNEKMRNGENIGVLATFEHEKIKERLKRGQRIVYDDSDSIVIDGEES